MRLKKKYLRCIDGSLHDSEVVSVQNGAHVRDLPSEDTETVKTTSPANTEMKLTE